MHVSDLLGCMQGDAEIGVKKCGCSTRLDYFITHTARLRLRTIIANL